MARVANYSPRAGRQTIQSVTRGYRNRDDGGPQSKPAFRDLQAHWYGKLKAEGFKDIEGSRDTNKLNTSTLPGDRFVFKAAGSKPHGILLDKSDEGAADVDWSLEINARIFGGEMAASDLPEAKAWRALSVAAHKLPRGWRGEPLNEVRAITGGALPKGHPGGRQFIIDVCQTGCIAYHLLQRHKLTRGWARKLWRDFVAQAKMPEAERLLVRGNVGGSRDAAGAQGCRAARVMVGRKDPKGA